MHRMVHFELHSPDVKKTNAFFADVFGWKLQQFGEHPYWIAVTGEGRGIDGGIMASRDGQQRTVNTIEVADLDAHMQQVKDAGGQIVVERMPIPGVGWLAYGTDPVGVLFGMMQPDSNAK